MFGGTASVGGVGDVGVGAEIDGVHLDVGGVGSVGAGVGVRVVGLVADLVNLL